MRVTTEPASSRPRLLIPIIGTAVIVVIGVVALVVHARNESSERPRTSNATTVVGLCQAAREAADGDRVAATNTFYDQSHQSLHVLAAQVESRDRSIATRLLETKNTVENELNIGGPALPGNLRALAEDARDAMRALGKPVPNGCTS